MCTATGAEYETDRNCEYGYQINTYTQSEILIKYHDQFKKETFSIV